MGKLKGFWRAKRGKKFAFWGSGGVELRQDCIKERVLERFSSSLVCVPLQRHLG